MSDRPYEELARRLCCAWLPYSLGISYDHCMKRYVKGGELGEYWQELAERVAGEAINLGT